MITRLNLSKTPVLDYSNSIGMMAAALIDKEIFTQIELNFGAINFSDLEALIAENIEKVLNSFEPELETLSYRFWEKSLKDPIDIQETLAALVLSFLRNLKSKKKQFRVILPKFASVTSARFVHILSRIIFSQELLSFNISAFLLFSEFKYLESITSELSLYSTTVSCIKDFNAYAQEFKDFLFRNSIFLEYFENLKSREIVEPFDKIIDQVLSNIVLVDQGTLSMYNVDGFTTFNLKIYLIMFETGQTILDKGATFYVLLHELCHFFRRISCKTWEESKECKTPEDIVGDSIISEAGDMFEIYFFGKRHNFLNFATCEFLLSSNGIMSTQEFNETFLKLNEKQDSVYVRLKRGNQASLPTETTPNHIVLRGCAFRKYRNLN